MDKSTLDKQLLVQALGRERYKGSKTSLECLPDTELADFNQKSVDIRKETIRSLWITTAYTLARRVQSFAQSCNEKELRSLVTLIQSSKVAHDKVFPQETDAGGGQRVLINLFGSLGQSTVKHILEPVPVRDVAQP